LQQIQTKSLLRTLQRDSSPRSQRAVKRIERRRKACLLFQYINAFWAAFIKI